MDTDMYLQSLILLETKLHKIYTINKSLYTTEKNFSVKNLLCE